MPWENKDAVRHTKKADTPEKQALWTRTANSALISTGNEGKAIRLANAAIRDFEPASGHR